MQGTYFFGLIVTGLPTLIPGRTMYFVVFGMDGARPAKLAVFVAVIIVIVAVAVGLMRWRRTKAGEEFVATH